MIVQEHGILDKIYIKITNYTVVDTTRKKYVRIFYIYF